MRKRKPSLWPSGWGNRREAREREIVWFSWQICWQRFKSIRDKPSDHIWSAVTCPLHTRVCLCIGVLRSGLNRETLSLWLARAYWNIQQWAVILCFLHTTFNSVIFITLFLSLLRCTSNVYDNRSLRHWVSWHLSNLTIQGPEAWLNVVLVTSCLQSWETPTLEMLSPLTFSWFNILVGRGSCRVTLSCSVSFRQTGLSACLSRL